MAAEGKEDIVQEKGYFILPSQLFQNVRAKAKADENLNVTLAELFDAIEVRDIFYSLSSSLTSGLPAEINARRQQYEYYRDKLLSFHCKTA